jgi:cobalt-zinc-cadmium efflux system outer membrane protein
MRCALLCAALAAALPSAVRAQSLVLTETEALARLTAEGPRARSIRATTDVVRAEAVAAGRWPNPRLTVDRESVAGVTEWLTMVAQPLPITGRRDFDIKAASALVEASAIRAGDLMRRARADLRVVFAQLLAAQTRERALTAARDRLRELADVVARREAAGDAAGFDRLRAEREVSDVDADLAAAASERARAQLSMASFFGDAIDPSRLVAAEPVAAPPPIPDLEPLIQRALSTRGEFLALAKEAEAGALSARAAERRAYPDPEIVAGTKSSTLAGGDLGSVIEFHVSIPVFDHGQPERAVAEARARQATAQAELLRITLRSEIATLRAAAIERRQTAERYRTSAVGGGAEIERVARVSYDAGERGILELLDAYRTGSSARVRQTALDLAARQAEIELEYASGWEIP